MTECSLSPSYQWKDEAGRSPLKGRAPAAVLDADGIYAQYLTEMSEIDNIFEGNWTPLSSGLEQ